MTLADLHDKKIAVLGLGVEGLSTAKYLHAHNIPVTVLDEDKIEEKQTKKFTELQIPFEIGQEAFSNLSNFDIIFRSPGIPLFHKSLQEAKANGAVITSQTHLFFDLCPCPIIGVTGTKGKGTTSSLLYEMLRNAKKDAYLGGNIGKPPLDFLDTLNHQSVVVVELSSFQLEDLKTSPHIAVLLMITSEHLGKDIYGTQNYHQSLEKYVDAKRNILRFQTSNDFAIVNRDYPASNESDIYTQGKVFYVSRERETDNGCFAFGAKIIIRKNGHDQEIIDRADILLPGAHNLENICAAVMAANLAGVAKTHIAEVLKTFKGLEHRLEFVREVNGVQYFDDSFSTTPETAIAAIEAFSQPEILILGGSSKHSDFDELGSIIARRDNIKAIIGTGVEWERIKISLFDHGVNLLMIEGAKTMQQIVAAASKLAEPGDVVLLSPACASFDMFANYKDRGEQFKEAVQSL